MNALRGNVTLDTSAIMEYLMGTELGQTVKTYFETLKSEEKVYCSLYNLSETFYVLCRLKGEEYATEKVKEMLDSQMIEIYNTREMALETGRLKCENAISMGNCSCIATAKITESRPLFAHKEKELVNAMKKRPLATEILFLVEA